MPSFQKLSWRPTGVLRNSALEERQMTRSRGRTPAAFFVVERTALKITQKPSTGVVTNTLEHLYT